MKFLVKLIVVAVVLALITFVILFAVDKFAPNVFANSVAPTLQQIKVLPAYDFLAKGANWLIALGNKG